MDKIISLAPVCMAMSIVVAYAKVALGMKLSVAKAWKLGQHSLIFSILFCNNDDSISYQFVHRILYRMSSWSKCFCCLLGFTYNSPSKIITNRVNESWKALSLEFMRKYALQDTPNDYAWMPFKVCFFSSKSLETWWSSTTDLALLLDWYAFYREERTKANFIEFQYP